MPFKDKEARKRYRHDYWQVYYQRNRERILAKNKAWAKTEKGKEYLRDYMRKKRARSDG